MVVISKLFLECDNVQSAGNQSHQQNLWAVKGSCSKCVTQSWRRWDMFLFGTPYFFYLHHPWTERGLFRNVLKWVVWSFFCILHRLVGLRHPWQTAWQSQLKRARVPVANRLTSKSYVLLVNSYVANNNRHHICTIKKTKHKKKTYDSRPRDSCDKFLRRNKE